MDIIPDKRKLVGLVEQAHKGELCLPDFQRSFVWERDEVADLLRSLLTLTAALRCRAASLRFCPYLPEQRAYSCSSRERSCSSVFSRTHSTAPGVLSHSVRALAK